MGYIDSIARAGTQVALTWFMVNRVPLHRILLAEDDPEFRRFLAEALRRDGYAVTETETGLALLDLLDELRAVPQRPAFDLVLSDQRMPGLLGLEVLSASGDHHDLPPFVLMSAFGGEALHAEARSLGAAAVLDKPFELSELRRTVRELLAASGG